MPYSINPVKAPDGTPCVMFSVEPEAMPVLNLLRMLKGAFREEYRQVWYEISDHNGQRFDKSLLLPGGLNGDTSERAGETDVSTKPAGTDLPDGERPPGNILDASGQ